MKLSAFLTFNAIMFIPFGIGMLLIPGTIFQLIDVVLDGDGLLMASTVGSMLLSFGLICLLARNESLPSAAMKSILVGNFSFHTIDCMLTFKGAFQGIMNSLGFVFSGMHFLVALGFLFFYFQNKKVSKIDVE